MIITLLSFLISHIVYRYRYLFVVLSYPSRHTLCICASHFLSIVSRTLLTSLTSHIPFLLSYFRSDSNLILIQPSFSRNAAFISQIERRHGAASRATQGQRGRMTAQTQPPHAPRMDAAPLPGTFFKSSAPSRTHPTHPFVAHTYSQYITRLRRTKYIVG